MNLIFPVQVKVAKPVSEVFDAVRDPKKIGQYFFNGSVSGPLDEGQELRVEFSDHPGGFPIFVKESRPNTKIAFEWEANDGSGKGAGYNTRVDITFTPISPDSTRVEITETGWREDAYRAAAGNGQGWMHFACCLKAFCEYGINLRKNFF